MGVALDFTMELLGWFGALAILTAFVLLQQKRVTTTDLSYLLLNTGGALAVMVNAAYHKAFPSAILAAATAVYFGYILVQTRIAFK